jgi:hypothetical protein
MQARIGSSPLPAPRGSGIFPSMSTLAEIEAAAEALPPQEQQELLLFLATRLHAAGGALPPPRDIPKEQIEKWIADDEAGYRRFLGGA